MKTISFYTPAKIQVQVEDPEDRAQVEKAVKSRCSNLPHSVKVVQRIMQEYTIRRHVVEPTKDTK